MIARMGTGWQTLMADLSIVLFMITAAALGQNGSGGNAANPPKPAQMPSQRSEPIAVYRPGPGMPGIGEWLSGQPRDPRQMLTIVSTYAPGKENAALDLATGLARQAGSAGQAARVVVEPGEGEATATLAYDASAVVLAQGLQSGGMQNPKGDAR